MEIDMAQNEKSDGALCMRKYLEQLEFAANLKDVDFSRQDAGTEPSQTRNIFIMRHGERVDFVFGDWVSHCFDEEGSYIQKDLNLPAALPKRESYPQSYILDTPITNIGMLQAESIGESFKTKNFDIQYVYCSPAFRCLQTCDAFLKGLGKKRTIKIRIEPALFEWIHWIGDFPSLMSANEMIENGYIIDTEYQPFMTERELKEKDETMEDHYERGHSFIKKIIQSHPVGNCLLVAHASTLDTCSRKLMNGKWLTPDQLMSFAHEIPYCSLVRLADDGVGWRFTAPPCPPMSYGNNKQFNWKVFLKSME